MAGSVGLSQEIVPNLVQGVSQQGQQMRRSTQCDSQFDCLNQPVEGCTQRPGFEIIKQVETAGDYSDGFFYDIIRSSTERYTICVRKDGTLKAWNYLTGVECTVEVIDSLATDYLASTLPAGALPWNNFSAATVDDVTFIANKAVAPQMGSTVSPVRPPEALFYIRAGGYLVTYTLRIKLSGTWFEWTYTTPDNSVAGNAAYITTDAICYALYNAMVTDPTNPIASGLHFNIQREGNLIRLWRTDGNDFDVETIDGQNNTMLIGLKGTVSGFDQLPASGFSGMLFKVLGDKSSDADDFFVQFNPNEPSGDSTTNGVWEETTEAGIVIDLDASTMPVSLVNDDVNHFTLGLGTWGQRLAGDGVNSSVDPSFTTHFIQDLFFDQRRLAIMTPASIVYSRVNNVFVFFPDTVQADLATAPIDIKIQSGKRIPILHKALQASAQTYIWAEGAQYQVSHGDNSVFSDQTIEADPSTAYEWNEDVQPLLIGQEAWFATEVGDWSSVTSIEFNQGYPVGDTGISEQVPNYIPKNIRQMLGSDTVKKGIIYSEDTPSLLYIYEYRLGQTERQQSAWSTWRLPSDCHVLHFWLDKHLIYVWVSRPDGLFLLSCSLRPSQTDTGGTYLTRLDMKVTEAAMTLAYDDILDVTTITLPFKLADAQPHVLDAPGNPTVQLVVRTSSGSGDTAFFRGQILTLNSVTTTSTTTVVKVNSDYTTALLFGGLRIRAERTENTFYVHNPSDGSYVYYDRLNVERAVLSYAKTAVMRVEVLDKTGAIAATQFFDGKEFGDPTAQYDEVLLATGDFDVGINSLNTDFQLRLVADTCLPAAWQGLVWHYKATVRASGS